MRGILGAAMMMLAAAPLHAQPTFPGESAAQRDARMQWWRDARYGMFIHWSASSVLGGEWNGKAYGDGCFLLQDAKMPVDDYATALATFNPVKFDAERWVLLAKEAGMKYIVFTAKHHDGFAMWDSKASAFNVVDHTPFGRDVVAELTAACEKHGLKLGLYYSHARDWYHPGGAIGLRDMPPWDEKQRGDFADYVHGVAVPQVRELLTNYGPIAALWWDTPDKMTPQLADAFTQLLPLRPGIVTNSRLLNRDGTGGDFDTPERYIPPYRRSPDRDMEVCMTIGRNWMHTRTDGDWQSAAQLLHQLIDIAGKGGNLLLNVAPTELGEMPAPSVERLRTIGRWLDAHGEAIYATRQGPFRYWDSGRATAKDGKLFLHVFNWPNDGKLLVPIAGAPSSAYALTNASQTFATRTTEHGLVIDVPDEPLDALASVIVVELADAPIAIRQGRLPDEAGTYHLTATNGERYGLRLRLVGDVIPNWPVSAYRVTWPIYVESPGDYTVRLVYSCDPQQAGGTMQVKFNEQTLTATTQATASLDDYRAFDAGRVRFDRAQSVEVELTQPQRPSPTAVRFKSIELVRE